MQNRQDGSNPQHVSYLATKCVLIAGIGGTMPTLTRLAGELVTKGNSSMPELSFFIGLALYFIAGAVVAYVYSEEKTNVRQAFVTGLAAPALISSMLSGASVGDMEKSSKQGHSQNSPGNRSDFFDFTSPVYAQQTENKHKRKEYAHRLDCCVLGRSR